MRLTLRTMLAYMDDILEPEDAADIGKKLEESDLAKTIMQRLRESIRRARLGAPPALGHGMGLDPNSVAEYLDNTLPAEQVGEFERICLESDMHLAEVGACHQILTLVLGEPAEVDAAARERMYHITARTAVPQGVPTQVSSPVAPRAVQAQTIRRVKPEVPEYLRESRSRHWGAIAAVLVLVLVSGGIATAVFLPEMLKIIASRENEAARDQVGGDTAVSDERPSQETVGDADTGSSDPVETQSATSDDSAAGGDVETTGAPDGSSEDQNADPAMAASDDDTPDELAPPDGEATAATPAVMPDDGKAAATGEPEMPVAAGAAATPEETPPGEVMGRYLNKQDVLLRMDRRARLWRRLAATPSLAVGDQLMSLPVFRPTINLIAGVTIQPVDAARFELLGLDNTGVPAIGLHYGRLVLFTAGKPQNSIRMQLGDHQALLTFVDGESTMAIDVRRQWIPGRNPNEGAGPLVADLFVTSGAVTWEENGNRAEWQAPLHATLDQRGVRVADNEMDKWTRGAALAKIERDAADAVEHELTPDRPVSLSVKELLGDRRIEVRTLGVRVAANLDEFEPLVKMLGDVNQKQLWQTEIDAMRAAMVRDPETAELVEGAFKSHRAADWAELYHLLYGYSADELAGDGMAKLVEYLNHDSLEFRVLAFNNLYEITGKTLSYRPEAPSRTRRQVYLKWKERIKELKAAPKGN